jgi:hypothetical protein
MGKPNIHTPRELVNHIKQVVGDKWYISVSDDRDTEYSPGHGSLNRRWWHCCVYLTRPVQIRASVLDRTFPGLVRRVEKELWKAIEAELLKHKRNGVPITITR